MSFATEFLGLPGLRGYWPMHAFDSSGNVFDMSGQGRTLTYNGNPLHNVVGTYNAPYLDLDATGDYLSRSDEAGLDILGTESFITAGLRGLTVGGWFWADTTVEAAGYITKYDGTAAGSNFVLIQTATDAVMFIVYNSTNQYVLSTANSTMSTGAWHFVVGRFTPGTEQAIFIDTNKTTDTTGIPASLNNSAAALEIGRLSGVALLNGRVSNCFLCAMVLADGILNTLYDNTKAYYGL